MEQETALKITALTTGYADKKLACGISAELHGGELTVMLGVNGVGKSTLLRTITGFQPMISGDVLIGGRRLGDYSQLELSRQVGVVLTHRPALNDISVRELVAMGRTPHTGFWGRNSREDERTVDEAIDMVRIGSYSKRMVNTLSDGEFQKAMIAKAIAQQTPVMVLDEPTAFLDFPSKVELMQTLRRIARERGVAVLVSTHDVELALHFADKVWVLNKDSLLSGSPRDIALEGGLDIFFTSDSIVFDRETMSYRMK